ncbi:MAG: hypothetical protein CM15mV8_1160 [Caudoviricetes sp.]|nr:MAG: hypothetical protein CM15mV8_1160 [Caudoviricetes sp.]
MLGRRVFTEYASKMKLDMHTKNAKMMNKYKKKNENIRISKLVIEEHEDFI